MSILIFFIMKIEIPLQKINDITSFYDDLEEIVSMNRHNHRIQECGFVKEIKDMKSPLKVWNLGKLLKKYKHEHVPNKPLNEELLSRFWLDLLQKGKTISLEAKRYRKNLANQQMRLNNYHENQIKLLEDETKLLEKEKKVSNKNKINIKKQRWQLRQERKLFRLIHKFDWKQYEQSVQRADAVIKHLNSFTNRFKIFLKKYDSYNASYALQSTYTCELTKMLNQTFDDDKEYLLSLRSVRRKSLKERISAWLYILILGDEKHVAQCYGYKTRKPLVMTLNPIKNEMGQPDYNKMKKLQRIERNRILVPETSDDEIDSLYYKFNLRESLEKMSIPEVSDKAEKLIAEIQSDMLFK